MTQHATVRRTVQTRGETHMHEIRIPRLGWSMEEGTLVRWLKGHGESVRKGDALFELEGDKNLQDIESVDSGTLHIPPESPRPGSRVEVGTLIGYLLAAGEAPPASGTQPEEGQQAAPSLVAAGPAARRIAAEFGIELAAISGTGRSGLITKEDAAAAAASLSHTSTVAPPPISPPRRIVASPRARRAARQLGIDWHSLAGTGRNGRIREADILAAQAASPVIAAASLPFAGSKLSPRRRAIAQRLRHSQANTIPVTLHTTADVTETAALRNRLKAANPASPPAYTDIVAALLPRVFAVHSQLAQVWDDSLEILVPFASNHANIGIAVETPDGLLVPVIRQAGTKTLSAITAESRRLIGLARSGQLPGDAMRAGHFTITNLGAFGIDGFTPVINLPEIAILGLGAIREEPAFMPDRSIEARQRMTLSLTFDHAAVDGAPAAAFLRDVAKALADPAAFLLG